MTGQFGFDGEKLAEGNHMVMLQHRFQKVALLKCFPSVHTKNENPACSNSCVTYFVTLS